MQLEKSKWPVRMLRTAFALTFVPLIASLVAGPAFEVGAIAPTLVRQSSHTAFQSQALVWLTWAVCLYPVQVLILALRHLLFFRSGLPKVIDIFQRERAASPYMAPLRQLGLIVALAAISAFIAWGGLLMDARDFILPTSQSFIAFAFEKIFCVVASLATFEVFLGLILSYASAFRNQSA